MSARVLHTPIGAAAAAATDTATSDTDGGSGAGAQRLLVVMFRECWGMHIAQNYVNTWYCCRLALCQLPAERGECPEEQAPDERWHFDGARERCERFTYAGCGGNLNNFRTRESCERGCALRKRKLMDISSFRIEFAISHAFLGGGGGVHWLDWVVFFGLCIFDGTNLDRFTIL